MVLFPFFLFLPPEAHRPFPFLTRTVTVRMQSRAGSGDRPALLDSRTDEWGQRGAVLGADYQLQDCKEAIHYGL